MAKNPTFLTSTLISFILLSLSSASAAAIPLGCTLFVNSTTPWSTPNQSFFLSFIPSPSSPSLYLAAITYSGGIPVWYPSPLHPPPPSPPPSPSPLPATSSSQTAPLSPYGSRTPPTPTSPPPPSTSPATSASPPSPPPQSNSPSTTPSTPSSRPRTSPPPPPPSPPSPPLTPPPSTTTSTTLTPPLLTLAAFLPPLLDQRGDPRPHTVYCDKWFSL